MAESLLPDPFQELLVNGTEPPESYICKGEDGVVASFPVMEVPLIDVGLLTSSSPAGNEELNKLRSALNSCGCIQAINHGMENSFIDKVREAAKLFFSLPTEEKQKYSRKVGELEGYGSGSALSQNQNLGWNDWLYLTVIPEDERKLMLWPENPKSFRGILHDYTVKLAMLSEVFLASMAKSLNLEQQDCFLNQYGERARMKAKFNLYPPCPRPDHFLGIKPHTDGSAITFLLQDKEVGGLQMQNDGQWFSVPTIPYAVLINLGDQAEIMSNGMFKSPLHRVVTNSERERITLVVFCLPRPDREIGPVEELIDEKRPRLYRKVKDYAAFYLENSKNGQRPIDAAKI